MNLLKRKVKLPQTLEGMDKFAIDVLTEYGFPTNQAYVSMLASFIQQSADEDDKVDTSLLARRIRRQVANEVAFYLIYPAKRAEYEAAKKEHDEKSKVDSTAKA